MDDDLQKSVVFYSWQSDSHDATNRSLIENALESVAKRIRNDDSIQVDPVVDRDTAGVAGAVDIATTIFSKISLADAFVADVSLVTHYTRDRDGEPRAAPNANVVTELGYAVAHLTWERVVLVFNEASGDFRHLPFDINRKKLVTYSSVKEDSDRATPRKQLESKLEEHLRGILLARRDTADVVVAALETGATQRIPLLKKALAELEKQLARHEPSSDADRADVTDALVDRYPRSSVSVGSALPLRMFATRTLCSSCTTGHWSSWPVGMPSTMTVRARHSNTTAFSVMKSSPRSSPPRWTRSNGPPSRNF